MVPVSGLLELEADEQLKWTSWDTIAPPEVEVEAEISLNFQDAVPVYLDMSTGKIPVRYANLDERWKRSLRKRRALKGETQELPDVESVTCPIDAVGASRREKNRLTFFCRQAIEGVFDPEQEMPTGHIKDSVLLVQASKPARLEDMSYQEAPSLSGSSSSSSSSTSSSSSSSD